MAAKPKPKSKPKNDVAVVEPALPAHLKNLGNIGNENVTQSDIIIPRIGIIQGLSPEIDPDNDFKYIDGAVQGQMFNSLTREVYDNLYLSNVFFETQHIIWKKRKAGGGFRGMGKTAAEAITIMESLEDADQCEIQDTAVHYCLIIDDKGNLVMAGNSVIEVALPMKSTQMKISRNWNSLIRLKGSIPRFSAVWQLTTSKETNDKGSFYNYNIKGLGYVTEATAKQAVVTYNAIVAGQRKVDTADMDMDDESADKNKKF